MYTILYTRSEKVLLHLIVGSSFIFLSAYQEWQTNCLSLFSHLQRQGQRHAQDTLTDHLTHSYLTEYGDDFDHKKVT